jgi:hypothetical protein
MIEYFTSPVALRIHFRISKNQSIRTKPMVSVNFIRSHGMHSKFPSATRKNALIFLVALGNFFSQLLRVQ